MAIDPVVIQGVNEWKQMAKSFRRILAAGDALERLDVSALQRNVTVVQGRLEELSRVEQEKRQRIDEATTEAAAISQKSKDMLEDAEKKAREKVERGQADAGRILADARAKADAIDKAAAEAKAAAEQELARLRALQNDARGKVATEENRLRDLQKEIKGIRERIGTM